MGLDFGATVTSTAGEIMETLLGFNPREVWQPAVFRDLVISRGGHIFIGQTTEKESGN